MFELDVFKKYCLGKRVLSVEILRNLLGKYGFKIVEYSCVTERTLKQPLGNKLMRFVTGLVESYGELINVVCVKQ